MVTTEAQPVYRGIGVPYDWNRCRVGGIKEFGAMLRAIERPVLDSLPRCVNAENVQEISAYDAKEHLEGRYAKVARQLTAMTDAGIHGVDFYIHGSMADKSDTMFSDVDDLVVIRRKAWSTDANLYKAAKYLARLARMYQSVDPLQHHGHILVTEYDLVHYDQGLFPLYLLSDNGRRVIGSSKIKYHTALSKSGMRRNIIGTANSMLRGLEMCRTAGRLRAYDLKCLIGEVLLMPAYTMQLQGKQVSKPKALQAAPEIYTENAIKALRWASNARNAFDLIVNTPKMKMLRVVVDGSCARRNQAEKIFKTFSPWISASSSLGIGADTAMAIESLARESLNLCGDCDEDKA